MYRLLLCVLVLLAAASVSLAADDKKTSAPVSKTADPEIDAQVVVVATPPPVSKGQIVFMVITACLLAVMLAQIVWLRSDVERLLGAKR
jgi:hypothetical protein